MCVGPAEHGIVRDFQINYIFRNTYFEILTRLLDFYVHPH